MLGLSPPLDALMRRAVAGLWLDLDALVILASSDDAPRRPSPDPALEVPGCTSDTESG